MTNYAVIADQEVADRYHLPVIDHGNTSDYNFWLQRINGALSLCQTIEPDIKPLALDFSRGKFAHRIKQTKSQREPLARACGFTRGRIPSVTDATAGLGQDSLLLAAMGANVTLIEQHPLIHAILNDALQRAMLGPDWLKMIVQRVNLIYGNSVAWLEQHEAEVVYLDPMYPEEGHSRTAKVKKGMQLLRLLPDTVTNHSELFSTGYHAFSERLVVKRPNWANPLSNIAISSSYNGKTHHFDIYLKR